MNDRGRPGLDDVRGAGRRRCQGSVAARCSFALDGTGTVSGLMRMVVDVSTGAVDRIVPNSVDSLPRTAERDRSGQDHERGRTGHEATGDARADAPGPAVRSSSR